MKYIKLLTEQVMLMCLGIHINDRIKKGSEFEREWRIWEDMGIVRARRGKRRNDYILILKKGKIIFKQFFCVANENTFS